MGQEINNSDIIFLTPTIGTKWIFYQQYLLKKFYPESKRVLINGNRRWDFDKGIDCIWYDFIKIALKYKSDYKYFVHIDEDCFITDPYGVIEVLEQLKDEKIGVTGPPDYFDKIRGGNQDVVNSFFMAGKISSLEVIMRNFDYNLKFKDLKKAHSSLIKEDIIEAEPYFNFFWNYMQQGFSIGKVNHKFDEKFLCTSLLNKKGDSFALHMWFTRKWASKEIFLGITMYERYKRVEQYLNKEFGISFFQIFKENKQLRDISAIQYTRIVSKNIFRVKER